MLSRVLRTVSGTLVARVRSAAGRYGSRPWSGDAGAGSLTSNRLRSGLDGPIPVSITWWVRGGAVLRRSGCPRARRPIATHFRDVCEYVIRTHRRFPAHTDAIHVPGIRLQTRHVERGYYERFFVNGPTDTQRRHAELWD